MRGVDRVNSCRVRILVVRAILGDQVGVQVKDAHFGQAALYTPSDPLSELNSFQ